MLRTQVLRDLQDDPRGAPLTIEQTAVALEISHARVTELALVGELKSRIEDGRVVSVDRPSVRALFERTRDRAIAH
jgi:hypothetical protein